MKPARRRLRRRLGTLFRQPVFWILTLWGHGAILAGTFAIYHFEHAVNPKLSHWLDTLFWSITTVTTVGYGDMPVTSEGKLVGIFMMVLGSLFLVSYTALFSSALVAPELLSVESEINALERNVKSVGREAHEDIAHTELLRQEIRELRRELQSLKPPISRPPLV